MSKKDYIILAKYIKAALPPHDRMSQDCYTIVDAVAEALAVVNERFNKEQFKEAIYG
jgi:hypothetical protein